MNSPRLIILGPVVILLATVLAYLPALRAGFIWNDNTYVHENRLLSPPSFANLAKIWVPQKVIRTTGQYYVPQTEQYYPLVFSSFWLESHLWPNTSPAGFHTVNILLHAANALLIWLICRRLGFAWGFLAALLFALHPVEVESVAWITERKNVLSGLFYLLALLAYLRFDDTQRARFYFIAKACFIFALLSKTVTASLPAVLLLILYLRHRHITWLDVRRLIPFFVLGAILGLFTAYLERHAVGAVGAEWHIAFWQRCIIAGRAVFFYLSKLLWPTNLTFTYPRWDPAGFSALSLLWPAAVILLTVGLWLGRKRIGPSAFIAWAAFIVSLFPALGFFNVYPFRYSFVADHFQYLASIFPIALFAGLAHYLYKRVHPQPPRLSALSIVSTLLAATVLLILGVLTYRQAGIYKDPKTLWLDTTARNPGAWMAWNNLGSIYLQEPNLSAAEDCYRKMLALRPDYAPSYANLGLALARQGHFTPAQEYFAQAIKLQPDYVWAYLNQANIYAQLRLYDQAIVGYQQTIRLAEGSDLAADRRNHRILAWRNLAGVYAEMGRYDLATAAAQTALELARSFHDDELTRQIEPQLVRYRRQIPP